MAVFLRRFVVPRHSKQLHNNIGGLRLFENASRRCLSSQGKPPVGPPTMNRSGRGFQSFRERKAERTRQSNAAGGWIVFSVAMAGGSISAVVMAYTEGAQSPVQQQLQHTDASLSVEQFLDQGLVLQVDKGDDGNSKNFHTKNQQFNEMHSLNFEDYILEDEYELLPPTAVTRHQLLRQTIQEIESNVTLETGEPGTAVVYDV